MFLDFFPAIQKGGKKRKLEELSKISREQALRVRWKMGGGGFLYLFIFIFSLGWEVGQSYSSADINRKLSASSFVYDYYSSIRQRAVLLSLIFQRNIFFLPPAPPWNECPSMTRYSRSTLGEFSSSD